MRGSGPARCTPGNASPAVLVHGRDLAIATGLDQTPDPDLTEACRQVIEPSWQRSAAPAPRPEVAIPADASAQIRFLALLGRTAERLTRGTLRQRNAAAD